MIIYDDLTVISLLSFFSLHTVKYCHVYLLFLQGSSSDQVLVSVLMTYAAPYLQLSL